MTVCLKRGNEHLVSIKCVGFLRVDEKTLAS
jgi:hypothetical protein